MGLMQGGSYQSYHDTVDGRNPAPVDRWFIPLFIGFQPSKVVQDFFHQQYGMILPQFPVGKSPAPTGICTSFSQCH